MNLLHPDASLPATVHADDLPWDPSPAAGVHRKRIERTGGEVARLTSIVRYAPDSAFPAHVHGGGEEYLVLDGVFSDERGDHGPGTYVRTGVGSRHTPATAPGCIILVKLWWMHPEETDSHVVTTGADAPWESTDFGRQLPLHRGAHDHVDLLRLDAGGHTVVDHPGGIEVFVVDGVVAVQDEPLPRWGWRRLPGDGPTRLRTATGALLYVKRGHLARPPAPPSDL